jgi:Holliday junction resolvase RusA-like endonuclease
VTAIDHRIGVPAALVFTVPGPCVPWMRAGSEGRARFTPKKQRVYQAHVAWCATAARAAARAYPQTSSKATRYAVALEVYMPDARRRDIDNGLKTILDACQRILWPDDSQVRRAYVDETIDREHPRVVVTVGFLPDEAIESKGARR